MSSGDLYRFTEKAPSWLKLCLGEEGIPEEFEYDDLTPHQHKVLQTLEILYVSVEKGDVEPFLKNGKIHFRKTGGS